MKTNSEKSGSDRVIPPVGENFHGCVVELDGQGVLIKGRSGAGKTSLALGLVQHYRTLGQTAFLVADDQYYLENTDGFIRASVPPSIQGMVEIAGYGIVTCETKSNTKINLVVNLVPDEELERMPENKQIELLEVFLATIEVPERHEAQSIRIIDAKLNSLLA